MSRPMVAEGCGADTDVNILLVTAMLHPGQELLDLMDVIQECCELSCECTAVFPV